MSPKRSLLIDEWYKNAKLWLRKLKATRPDDYSYRYAAQKELSRCFRRIEFLKNLEEES